MMRDAVFSARDYMDFSQGGWLTKFLDNGIPYLNASVVGMRTFTRSFKGGKKTSQKAWWKLGQFALFTAGLYIASKKWAPETMKDLGGDVRSQNNIIIPLGDIFGFEDEAGQKRYPFITIPLDQNVRSLKKFFEFSIDEMSGDKPDVKGVFNSIKQISPVGLSSMPPLENAIFEYFANYDTYKMKNIRKEGEIFGAPKSASEFGPDTPQALIDLGKITGASPERIKVAMSEMISQNSTWATIMGGAYNEMFKQMPEDNRNWHLTEIASQFPIVRRFIGLTNPGSRFTESIENTNEEYAWNRFNQKNGLDILINGYLVKHSKNEVSLFGNKYSPTRDGIERYMIQFDKKDYDRLNDRLIFAEKTIDMPHRSLWMRMEAQAPEARAKTYLDEVFNDTELFNEFTNVNEMMRRTKRGGLANQAFREALEKIQK